MDTQARREPRLTLLESVRCLECGWIYAKPSDGGTVEQNPGCPDCGYAGWLALSVPISGALARRRSGEDRPRHLRVQPR